MPQEQPVIVQPTGTVPSTAADPAPPNLPAASAPTPISISRRPHPLRFALLLLCVLAVIMVYAVLTRPHPKLASAVTPLLATVHITPQGFQPATIVIKPGTKVVWINDDTQQNHLVAANPYPSDTSVPGLKSTQLGNTAQFGFTFTRAGSFQYHDDLNPSLNGTVTVR